MIIDLTMNLFNDVVPFPGFEPPEIKDVTTVSKEGWNVRRVSTNTHFATHIDAPYHMLTDGKRLEEYAPETFVGSARIVDVGDAKTITEAHVPTGIKERMLIFRTGHCNLRKTEGYFQNNPVMTEDAAKAIVREGVQIVGIDSFTVDNFPFDVHKIFFRADILILENLINLDKLSDTCRLIVAPLKLTDADGAPARVFAEVG